MRYRRTDIKGGSYFFTVNLDNRQSSLLIDEIDRLGDVIRRVKNRHPFQLDAIVVLPEHMHAIWTLPQGDSDYSTRWMLIKSAFSRQLPKTEHRSASKRKKGERGIWQRRYWEHLIRDEMDFQRHVDYIHFNPVKHGHAMRASDWKYSSIHRFIANGLIDRFWGSQIELPEINGYGERQ